MDEFSPKSFAKLIHTMEKRTSSDDVYGLLCRLAGTVSKQYDDEEQLMALKEECEMWKKDTSCFRE